MNLSSSTPVVAAALGGLERRRRELAGRPASRWPITWHLTLALGALVAGGMLALSLNHWLELRSREAARSLRIATARQAESRRLMPAIPAQPVLPLIEERGLEDVVRDISRFAASRSVRIAALKLEHAAPSGDFAQVRLTATATGEYGALKSWLSELLARYPSLAVQSLALQAPAQGGGPVVAANTTFVLFVKPRP